MTMHSTDQKILPLDELAAHLDALRRTGTRVVLCHGVFDLLHVGHIEHLEEAGAMGDALVVTLTPDRFVNKGPHRPAFPEALRARAVAALASVSYVAVNRWPNSVETIRLLRPSVYVKGPDYKDTGADITGGIVAERTAVESVGGEIRFTQGATFSSSQLLNQHFSPFSRDVDEYLAGFRASFNADAVLSWLNRVETLRPVVVGEAIIDEYEFCDGIGKSTKDPVLAVLQHDVQAYPGGSLAVANHLAGLCRHVGLVTQLGDRLGREDFVRSALKPNVEASLLSKANAPTIHKRRIVDRYSGSKLLEIYVMDDRLLEAGESAALSAELARTCRPADLTIVADYGHGMMSPDAIRSLSDASRFLAVNVQSNAGNRGFNPVSKYQRADYLCLANHELMLETRRKDGDAEAEILEVARRVSCPRFTVTMGKTGTLHYDVALGFTRAPALATKVLDRVGAGDGVLAVTSLLVCAGAPWEVVAFVGNVAGAHMVSELGNSSTLDKVSLSKHIVSLLK